MFKATKLLYVLALCLTFTLPYSGARASRIQYGELESATTLDPITNTNMVSRRLCELIYSGLVDFDQDHKPIWRLATGEPSEGHQIEYTFDLREAYWHDGRKLTAEDVMFTVEAMKKAPNRRTMVDSIYEIYNDDNSTLKFILKKPILNVLGRLAFKIIPKHVAQVFPIMADNPVATEPVGTGPYQFVRKDRNGVVYLKKNERYFDNDSPPQIDEIEMRPCGTEDVVYNSLRYGAINVAVSLHPRYADRITAGFQSDDPDRPIEPLAIEPYNPLSYEFFALNLSPERNTVGTRFLRGDGGGDNGVKVRQALNYGTNRHDWIEMILYGGAELISGPFAPGSPYYNEEVPIYPYDLGKANQLLDEAGFSERDAEDYRKNRNGETIVLKVIKRFNVKEEAKIWEAFEDDLDKLGIKVQAEVLDREDWKRRVYYEHDFDVAFDSRSFSSAGEIYSLFHSSQSDPGGDNFVSYSNKYVDLLLDKSREVLDAKQVQNINKILHETVNQECPYIFLWSPQKYACRTRRIRNFKIHPYAFFTYVTDWYLEE